MKMDLALNSLQTNKLTKKNKHTKRLQNVAKSQFESRPVFLLDCFPYQI